MSHRCGPLLFLVSLLLPPEGAAQEPVRRPGRHYEVVLHPGDLSAELAGRLAEECRRDLDLFGAKLRDLTGRSNIPTRAIHIYRDEAEYRAAETPMTTFEFETDGFVSGDLVGYVLMQPRIATDLLDATGTPGSTKDTLLRVAAELGIAPLVPESDREGWLRWLLVMGAVETSNNPTHRPGIDAAHDYRRSTVVTRLGLGWEFTLERMISTEMRWAESWRWQTTIIDLALLAQCLSERNPSWAKQLLRKHSLPQGQSGELARRTAAVKAVVGNGWEDSQAHFATMIAGLKSRWYATRGLWELGDRGLLIGLPDGDGLIRRSGLPQGDYAIRARFEIGPGRKKPVTISVGPDGLFQITAWFNDGEIGFSRLNLKTREWDSKAHAHVKIEAGVPFDFQFVIGKTTLRLAVDGKEVLMWDHDGGEMHSHAYIGVTDRILWIDKLDILPLEAGGGR